MLLGEQQNYPELPDSRLRVHHVGRTAEKEKAALGFNMWNETMMKKWQFAMVEKRQIWINKLRRI